MSKAAYQFLPLVHDWILKALVENYVEFAKKDLPKLSKVAADVIGLRGEAMVAKAPGRVDWVRS